MEEASLQCSRNKPTKDEEDMKTYLNFLLRKATLKSPRQRLCMCVLVLEIWVVMLMMSLLVIYYLERMKRKFKSPISRYKIVLPVIDLCVCVRVVQEITFFKNRENLSVRLLLLLWLCC